MPEDREPAEWCRKPEDALRHYLSLPYEEQIALAFVANWLKAATQKRAAELYEELKAQYVKETG